MVVRVRDRSGATGRKVEVWHWDKQTFGAADGMVWLEHRERDGTGYALAVAVVGASAAGRIAEPGHRAEVVLADAGKQAEQAFTILIAAVSTSESPKPLSAAKAIIKKAAVEDAARRLAKHNAYWHTFWCKSFIEFSDKYLENLWYLNLYCMGCTSRGKYPANFENSYFGARGFWMWGAYWQFNEQSLYFPLDMANHPELMEPYTRWIRDALPRAKLQTLAQFGIDGAQYSHCMSLTGQPFQGPGDMIKYVLSSCGLYALYMWQHYQHTMDTAFLRERAYPVMREAGKFYHGYLKNQVGPDGKYIIYPGHPIEEMDYTAGNCTIDIAVIGGLAKALIEAERALGVGGAMTATWRELADRMPPYPVRDGVWLSAECYVGPEFQVLPASASYDALPAWCAFPEGWKGEPKGRQYYGMGTQLAPVFPVGQVGLSSDPDVLKLARNTYIKTGEPTGRSWSPNHICGARLGLRKRVLRNVVAHVRWGQITPQGFMSYIGNRNALITQQERGGGYFDRLDKPRYEPYFEVSGVIATAIGYMLFDSLDGTIRVFPALPLAGDARVVMRATGAFIVTAEMRAGDIAYVTVASEHGAQCRVANPWATGKVRVREAVGGRIVVPATTDRVLTFPTVKGRAYTVEREAKPADAFPVVKVGGMRRTGPRLLPPVMLGMPREGWKRYSGPGRRAVQEQKWRIKLAELRPPGLRNYAAGATARVLRPHPAAKVKCLVDGIYGNKHSVISSAKAAPWEFAVDFGREATIGSVVWSRDRTLKGYRDRMPVAYRIEVSGDGRTWRTVVTVTDNKTAAGRRDSFAPVTARHVRMVVLKTNGLPPCLDEMEALSPDPRWKPKATPPAVGVPRVTGADPAALRRALADSGAVMADFLLLGSDYVGPCLTQVRAGHDGQRLFLLVTCPQPEQTPAPAALPRDAQALFRNDHIELFIMPKPAGAVYYQLGFDAAGNRYDARCVKQSVTGDANEFMSHVKWNPEWRADVTRGKDAWTAVVALPLKDLGLAPGRRFGLNVTRTRPLRFGPEHTSWSRLTSAYRETGRFGSATLR